MNSSNVTQKIKQVLAENDDLISETQGMKKKLVNGANQLKTTTCKNQTPVSKGIRNTQKLLAAPDTWNHNEILWNRIKAADEDCLHEILQQDREVSEDPLSEEIRKAVKSYKELEQEVFHDFILRKNNINSQNLK